jgi:hypothetical protein
MGGTCVRARNHSLAQDEMRPTAGERSRALDAVGWLNDSNDTKQSLREMRDRPETNDAAGDITPNERSTNHIWPR